MWGENTLEFILSTADLVEGTPVNSPTSLFNRVFGWCGEVLFPHLTELSTVSVEEETPVVTEEAETKEDDTNAKED